MEVLRGDSVELRSEHDIVMARQAVRGLCQELKFSLVDLTKMVTAASELARNTLLHGKGGRMRWELVRKDERNGVKLMFEDEGPGIPDLDLAMTDGWTSGKGLGKGLPGSRRLVNEFELESTPGQGTRVSITRWK
ncbi:MAG: anti-sigma regulatory factor [Nevskiales bacterium]